MRLIIKKLFGKYDYDIDFNKPINILIGENGCGKSTILKALYYLGKRDFISLANVKFEELTIIHKKYKERIVRNALLQHSFVSAVDFKRNFYRFLIEYLDNTKVDLSAMPYAIKSDKSFADFYKELISSFGKGENEYNYIHVEDSESYLEELINDAAMFYFGKVLNGDDKYYYRLPQSYLGKLLEDNGCIYGSSLYFKVIYEFFIAYYPVKKELLKHKAYDKDYMHDAVYDYFEENKYKYVKNLQKIIGSANIYDYVNFNEKETNLYEQVRNIRFFDKETHDDILEKTYELMGEKSESQLADGFLISDIENWDKTINFFSLVVHDMGKGGLLYLGLDEEKSKKRQNLIARLSDESLDDYNHYGYFLNDGYNYDKVFDYFSKNLDKYHMNNYQFQLFNSLVKHYISNKRIEINNNKISFSGGKSMDIFDITAKNGNKITYDQLSSGEKKIIRLLMMIVFDKKEYKYLLIDEPELSLSPFWQGMLLDDIKKYCNDCKVIISTQSPNLINDDQLDWLIEVKKEA